MNIQKSQQLYYKLNLDELLDHFGEFFLISESLPLQPTHRKASSGNQQRGVINAPLANPFVVEIQDQIRRKLVGWPVTFAVTTGDGTLSIENTETDAKGRAQTTLTLGPIQGINTVEAIISGLEPLVFTAWGGKLPRPLRMDDSYQTWNLPLGTIGRFGKGEVRAVTFSPDGNTFAVGSSIGTWLYDTATSRELALLTGHTDAVTSVIFSPDGTKLVSVGGRVDGTVKLWDILTGKNIATFIDDTNSVTSVALSPDGTRIAAVSHGSFNPGRITLWDVETRANIATFQGGMEDFSALTFSPDGKNLASGSHDGKIKIWDVQTGQNTDFAGHADAVRSIVYSPDGTKIVSAGGRDDNTIRLWDVATGNRIGIIRTNALVSMALSPDSTQIVSGEGYYRFGRVKLWDVATGNNTTLTRHTSGVRSVAFSPDGTKILSGSRDNTIKLWDVSTDSTIATLEHIILDTVACSSDGRTLASTSANQEIRLWNVATGENTTTLTGHTDTVRTLAFSPDGTTLASATQTGEIRLWNAATGQNTYTLVGHTDSVRSLAFSPDGATLASGAEDAKVKLWNVATGENITTLTGQERNISSLAFSPDGMTLASGSINIMLWDVPSRQHIGTLLKYGHGVASLAFSPDGAILATGSEKLKLWDIATKENIATLQGHTTSISYVSFPLNTTTLFSASYDGTVLLWDMSPYLTPIAQPPDVSTLAEDVNNDGVVNIVDLTLVASNFGQFGANAADVNDDGVVNIVDLTLVAGAFGNTAAAPEIWSLDMKYMLARTVVEAWLRQAQQMNLEDPAFQRGILILEQLLASLTPKETVLLPNYPNPFNPETWIPYQLAEPADVNISIYTTDGKLVRTLVLGHQSVGIYESRNRAAYWDGRNALGEPVASGVYFYTLTTGDFTETRKMLIRK